MYSLVIVVYQLSSDIKAVYKTTRFSVAKDTWPPEQPKEFTPLVLLHHEHEHSMEHVTVITKALNTGAISDVISATSGDPLAMQPSLHHHDKLREALKASKTTTDVSQILAPLEISDKPQTILIEGAPGIGKTILLKHIAFSWAEQRMLQKYELVLLVHLRDPIIQKMSSLKELFQYFCKHNMEGDEVTMCIKHISSNQGKILTFLLDGYDELPKEVRDNSLIADILNRQVLPDCGLVVSSRPHASMLLHKQATLRIDILGFTEQQRKHYIEHSLNDQSQIKQLTTYLEQHMIISSLCYVPFNIVLLLFLYKQGVTLPKNATQLYNIFICLTIRRHLTKQGITTKQPITDINNLPEPYGKFIQQLSKLCLHGLNNNQLIFTLDQIKQWCPQVESIPGAQNAFGLLQTIEHVSIFQTTTTFNFLHLCVQEFLAANHITTLTPDEEFTILNKYFWTDTHTNLFTIYLTLTEGQQSSFRKFLSGGNDTIAIHSKFLNDQLKCIQLYRCFNEASSDDHVCRTIERKFSNGIISLNYTTLSTNDIENIATLLSCSSIKQWRKLYLIVCHIRDTGLHIIHRTITSSLASSITIEVLWLSDNDLSSSSDDCLANIVITCRVKLLGISYNKTIGQTEEFFPTILSPSSSMIESLYIAGVQLSNRATILIFTLLKENTKLKELDIANNSFTDDACDIIAETLQINSTLEDLNIHGNKISKEAILLILNSLRHNDTLTQLNILHKGDKKQVLQLRDIVNEERKHRGCQAKLNVEFSLL